MSGCIQKFEAEAKVLLEARVYHYIAGAAGDESGLSGNHADLQSVQLMSRVLRGVGTKDVTLDVTLLGKTYPSPILIAPMGYQSMVHPDGEVEMARAARTTESVMVVPTLATQDLEKISATRADLWFQLYFLKDRGMTRSLVERAVHVGCQALVLTVDVPCRGARYRDAKTGFRISKEFLPKNFLPAHFFENSREDFRPQLADLIQGVLSWSDVEWLQSICKIPLILKGILNPEDAKIAANNQIRGIIVSNHGARQFDALVSPVTVLPEIRNVVGSKIEILVDSGIRSGSDVVRLLCLGASAVMLGRPVLWGLAARGAEGAKMVMDELKDELKIGMTMLGARSLSDLNPELVFQRKCK